MWNIDLSGWTTMEPILNWQEAATAGNMIAMTKIMVEVIKAWPLEGDPTNYDTYKKISPADWGKALAEVGQAVGNLFRTPGN